MKITFWGVRGSTPTPITSDQVKAKIDAAVRRITQEDIASDAARERFIESLPLWLYGTVGGNTPCVEAKTSTGAEMIFDCGSGLRVFGKKGQKPADNHYNIFLSHFHWDHLQGIPFFDAIYSPFAELDFYSTFPAAETLIAEQMERPYFPATLRSCPALFNFHTLKPGVPFTVDGHEMCCCKMSHPGNSYSYALNDGDKKFVYATDVELSEKDFERTESHEYVFRSADAIVLDAQYTVSEARIKENWGHSAFSFAIDFAVHWGIKSIYLFHHEPTYDDRKLHSILNAARDYAESIEHPEIKTYLATEGLVLDL